MPVINVQFHTPGDPPIWPELDAKLDTYTLMGADAPPISAAVIVGGMKSGLPSVALRFELPDGRTAIVETSGQAICALAAAIRGRCPEVDA